MKPKNPFSFGPPLNSDSDSFILRETELKDFYQLLASSGSVALVGPRRSGKTTFLLTIKNNPPEKYLPVLIDLQAILVDSVKQLFIQLTNEIENSLSFNLKAEVDNGRDFILYVEKVLKRLNNENKKLVLLFDEFDSLPQDQCDFLSTTLRALIERSYIRPDIGKNLRLVICGWSNLYSTQSLGSPLANILSTYLLEYFTKAETEETLNNIQKYLLKDQIPNSFQDFKERAFYWTSGHPYLVQAIGFLTLQKIRQPIINLNALFVDNIINEVITLTEGFFRSSLEKIKRDREALDELNYIWNEKPVKFSLFSKKISKLYFEGFIREKSNLCIVSSPIHEKVIAELMLGPNELILTETDIKRVMDQVINRI